MKFIKKPSIKLKNLSYFKLVLLIFQLVLVFVFITKGGMKYYHTLQKNPQLSLEHIFLFKDNYNALTGFYAKLRGNMTARPQTFEELRQMKDLNVEQRPNAAPINMIDRIWMGIKAFFLTTVFLFVIYDILRLHLNKKIFRRIIIFKLLIIFTLLTTGFIATLHDMRFEFLDFGSVLEMDVKSYFQIIKLPVLTILLFTWWDVFQVNARILDETGGGSHAPAKSHNAPKKKEAHKDTHGHGDDEHQEHHDEAHDDHHNDAHQNAESHDAHSEHQKEHH